MSLDDENYDFSISQTLGKLTVKKKALEIKVTGAQRPYGDTDFQTEYTYSGFVNDETEESLTAKPSFTVSDSITEATPVGKYDGVVTADGAESNNYSISYVYENGSAAPEKEGHKFDGWYADKELTNKFDFASKITKNITLYAKWTENKDDEKTTEPSEIENPFKDVKDDDWFKDAVIYGVGKGIFKGKTSDTFGPNDVITRGMMATVLYRIEGEPEVNEKSTFTDVEAGSYCENAVAWAQKNNIVKGYSDTSYMPDKDISREEMAAIIHRYSIFKELKNEYDGDIESFTDKSEVADWAKADVIWAVGSGLISGKSDNLLDPKGIATRAETAQIIKRFLELNK